jgi:hypothetical protein
MKPLIRAALAASAVVFSFWSAAEAEARPLVGVRAGQYANIGDSDVDETFVGVEVIAGVTRRVYFNPNLEYVLIEEGKLGTGNLDFHLDLPVADEVHLWLGAGLAVVYADPDGPIESDTDLGLNLLAGIGFQAGPVIPYLQGKLILVEEEEQLVWAVGIRF